MDVCMQLVPSKDSQQQVSALLFLNCTGLQLPAPLASVCLYNLEDEGDAGENTDWLGMYPGRKRHAYYRKGATQEGESLVAR